MTAAPSEGRPPAARIGGIADVTELLAGQDYLADRGLSTALYLSLILPLLLLLLLPNFVAWYRLKLPCPPACSALTPP